MKTIVSISLVLFWSAAALAEDSPQFKTFARFLQQYAQTARVSVPYSAVEAETGSANIEAQTECSGIADRVTCRITASPSVLAVADDARIEWMAAHEMCHIARRDFDLDVLDYIERHGEIEHGTDKCAFVLMGRDKFVPVWVKLYYEGDDPQHTVPLDALERAIVDAYGPK